jgi:hypothetical protein
MSLSEQSLPRLTAMFSGDHPTLFHSLCAQSAIRDHRSTEKSNNPQDGSRPRNTSAQTDEAPQAEFKGKAAAFAP